MQIPMRGILLAATISLAAALPFVDQASACTIIANADAFAALPGDHEAFDPTGVNVTVTDSFGSITGPLTDYTSHAASGQFQTHFACHSYRYPCEGAYDYRLVLPFQVTGFAADVTAQTAISYEDKELTLWGIRYSFEFRYPPLLFTSRHSSSPPPSRRRTSSTFTGPAASIAATTISLPSLPTSNISGLRPFPNLARAPCLAPA